MAIFEGFCGARSLDLVPAFAGVEGFHFGGELFGVVAEVLLVDDTVGAHGEGHDAGIAVVGGPGDDGEADGHLAVDDVIDGAVGGAGALGFEDAVVVAVVGGAAGLRALVAFG